MQIKYVPEAVKQKQFEGYIILTAPSFDEKYSYLEQCEFELDEEGNPKQNQNYFGKIRKMVSLSEKHYEEVKLKHVESGREYKSFDELSFDSECHNILSEIGGVILRGFSLGKS